MPMSLIPQIRQQQPPPLFLFFLLMTIGGALLNQHCCWYRCYCCCCCCCFANNLHTDLAAPEQLQVNAKTHKILACLDSLYLNLKNDLHQHVTTPESLNLSTLDMDNPVSIFMLIVTSEINLRQRATSSTALPANNRCIFQF